MDKAGSYKSPMHLHAFNFIWEGTIRFGPTYYRIELDGVRIRNRFFGFEFKWHPKAEYLALQEWLTTDYAKGPITCLTLIDLRHKKIAQISKANSGYIRPIKFIENKIVFEKEYLSQGVIKEFEIELNHITNWQETNLQRKKFPD